MSDRTCYRPFSVDCTTKLLSVEALSGSFYLLLICSRPELEITCFPNNLFVGATVEVLKDTDISTGTLKGVRGLRRGPLYRVSDAYQKKKKSINLIVKIPPGNLCKMYFVSFYINMIQVKLNIVYCLLEFKHAMLFFNSCFWTWKWYCLGWSLIGCRRILLCGFSLLPSVVLYVTLIHTFLLQ